MRPVGNSTMAPSSISRVPKRELSTVTVDIGGIAPWVPRDGRGLGSRAVLAQEVHEGRLHEVRSRAESGLVSGGLGVQVDERLRDVGVLDVRELTDRRLLALLEPPVRGVEPRGLRAVGGADSEQVVD